MTQNLGTSEISQSSSTPAAQPAVNMDDYIPKTYANELIHERTKQASEKAEQRGYERARQEFATQQQPTQQAYSPSLGGMSGPSKEEINQMIAEVTQRKMQEFQQMGAWQNTAETFVNRIQAAKEKDPELEKDLLELGIAKHPDVINMLNSIDNTAEVARDLRNNPEKLFMISAMTKQGEYDLARLKINQLSASIKANTEAKNTPTPKAPLSQVTPSNLSADSGQMTQADYRKMYY